ncbi:acetyl-CoA synthetase-like protein, partial [Neolentinus lepideus HHB14362 ss-1]
PPLDGSLSLPELVDLRLQQNPQSIYAVLPANDPKDRPIHITMFEWCRGIHRLARALRPQPSYEAREVVALILNCDTILYTTAVVAVMRAGLIPYPMSNRNSPAAIFHMLRTTSCHHLIVTSNTLAGLVTGIMAEASSQDYRIQIDELPCLYDIFPHFGYETAGDDFVSYPALNKCGPDEIITYIHSSGSTGFPKSIPHTNKSLMGWYASPFGADIPRYPKHLTFCTFAAPTFHMMGMGFQIWAPLIVGSTATMFPPKAPAFPVVPTPDNILEGMRITGVNAVISVPTFVEAWSESDEAVKFLSTMEVVISGGGPLAVDIGDRLVAKGVHLRSGYAGTEFGAPSYFIPPQGLIDPKDWNYVHFDPRVSIRMAPRDEGKYELQILNSESHPVLIHNISDVCGYATSDLFEKHPVKEGLWKIIGRVDDVITLASGEKTVPAPMESKILSSPLVVGAIMFGRGRNQVGVLIEPRQEHLMNTDDPASLADFRNQIWSIVEEANKDAPGFSRIFKEMILVTSPEKPLRRTPKGTVMRKPT